MAETKIEWTGTPFNGVMLPGYTFNAWIGCHKVSEGCKNCYAEADMDNRRGRVTWGINGTRSVTSYSYWRQVLSWNNQAAAAGHRRKVFCSSLADIFEDWAGHVIDSRKQPLWWKSEWCNASLGLAHTCDDPFAGEKWCDVDGVPTFAHWNEEYMAKHLTTMDGWQPLTLTIIREYLFRLIQMTPNLDWLMLTKRPENIMKMVPEHWHIKFPDNVWIGTTVENQAAANKRVPELLKVPAKVRFLSCEPMLEEVSLNQLIREEDGTAWVDNCLTGFKAHGAGGWYAEKVNWVICGGESGQHKRPFDKAWAISLMEQCVSAGVPFFMKQIDKVQPVPDYLMVRQFPKV